MAMLAGSASASTGLAKDIFDAIETVFGTVVRERDRQALFDLSDALAAAIVGHIKNNADVIVGISDSGLQRSTSVGTATDAPVAPVTIAGAID